MDQKDDVFWPLFFIVVNIILSILIGCDNSIQGAEYESQCMYANDTARDTVRDTGSCAVYKVNGKDTLRYVGSGWVL